jgi:hypothetical protein
MCDKNMGFAICVIFDDVKVPDGTTVPIQAEVSSVLILNGCRGRAGGTPSTPIGHDRRNEGGGATGQ